MILSTLFGDEILTKQCIKCNTHKPLTSFNSRTRNKKGEKTELRNDCNDCNRKQSRIVKNLKRNYPYPDKYYQCPICTRNETSILSKSKYKTAFVLEHDHSSGVYRGYVCQDCNTAIARLHDDIESAKRLVEYLSHY
jgi:hypothetical protein